MNSVEFYQEKVDKLGKNFKLSGPYRGAREKLNCLCLSCNHSWESLPENILRNGCPCCSRRLKWTKERLQEYLDRECKGLQVLSDNIKNSRTKIEIRCIKCSYEWLSSPSSFLKNGCPSCSNSLPLSLEVVQDRLDRSGRNIKVSGVYKTNQHPIVCTCKLCGNEWNSTPGNLFAGVRCKVCEPVVGGGFDYSKPALLYYLRVKDESGKNYWKIGITNSDIPKRFKRGGDMEKITTLYKFRFEVGAQAADAEKNILKIFKDFLVQDLNILKSGGNTELFNCDVLQMNHLKEEIDN